MKKLCGILGLILLANVSFAAFAIDIELLREQGHAAKLKGQAALMEKKYTQVLLANPSDTDAAFNIALAQSWQPQKLAQASYNFQIFLKRHPYNKQAWIAYINLESWRQHLDMAFELLEAYKERFGKTADYRTTRARLLSLSGHYNQALALNTFLLMKNPRDYDLLYIQTRTLLKAKQFDEAQTQLQQLKRLSLNKDETKELENEFMSLTKSPFSAGYNYYFDNQHLRNVMIPFDLDLALNYNTQILVRGLHEILSTNHNSPLQTIHGHSSIYDDSAMAGVRLRVIPMLAFTGMVGDLKIEDIHDKLIYLVNLNFAFDKNVNLNLTHLRNLYRPYLYPTSPKSVSLGITEYLTAANLFWQPWLYTSVNILTKYSFLSDNNHYAYVNITPTQQFILNSKLTATLGADAEFLFFSHQPDHGYYAPRDHQQYLLTAGLIYTPTTHFSTSISAGVGTHEEDITSKFEPAGSAYASLSYSVSLLEFNLSLDYTYQGAGNRFKNYQGLSTQASVVMRF